MSVETDNEFVFTWTIENYLYSPQKFREAIESPPFTVKTISNCKFVLLMYPKGCFEQYKNYVRYALKRIQPDENLKDRVIKYNIEILKEDGSILNSSHEATATLTDVSKTTGYGWTGSVEIVGLENEIKTWTTGNLTLRCRIMCDKKRQKHEAMICKGVTQFGVDCGTFTWTVQSLSSVQWTEVINFCIPGIAQFELTLSAPEEDVVIHIRCIDAPLSVPRFAKFKLTFLGRKELVFDSKKEYHLLDTSETLSWNFPNFIKKEKLQINIKGLIFYDFTIKGKVTTSNGKTISRGANYSYIFPSHLTKMGSLLEDNTLENNCKSIQSNLKNLFTSKKHCDVTLRVGNDEFPAHKLVLTARSPVFSVMFDQEMSESQTGIVEIIDVDSEILKIFLEYIYTDSVDKMDYEMAKSLLLVADKYDVVSLKEKCSVFLTSVLSVENACDVTIISEMVRDNSLKNSAIHIIKQNASEVLSSPQWIELIENNAKLATEILLALSKDFGLAKKTI